MRWIKDREAQDFQYSIVNTKIAKAPYSIKSMVHVDLKVNLELMEDEIIKKFCDLVHFTTVSFR